MRFSRCAALTLLVAALCAWAPSAGYGREYAPRVISEHDADAYSMKTFRRFHRWQGLEGEALAAEIYRYLADPRTGLYPMGLGAWEGRPGDLYEYRVVRDPVKMINTHVASYCDVLGPTMAGVWRDMGAGPARIIDIHDFGHVASEVFYGGKWHYLDLDLRASLRRPDGSLASFEEARTDPAAWAQARGPLFFPVDDPVNVRRIYEKSRVSYRHPVTAGGHTMDYVLRRGETFTRWWTPQGGRWHHDGSYNEGDFFPKLIAREPRGPKCKHDGYTVHTYGNGRFVYQPTLRSWSRDFADGVYDSDNARPDSGGLGVIDRRGVTGGTGYAVFEVRSPYVIVPVVGDVTTTDDDYGASVVEVDPVSAMLSVSTDNGRTWKDLEVVEHPDPEQDQWRGVVDLTRYVSGRYSYLLRVKLSYGSELRAMRTTTWVQVAPASLPSLRKGLNRMEYRTGDHYGLQSRLLSVTPDAGVKQDLLKYLAEPPGDYDPNRKTGRIVGPCVLKVVPPPGTKVAWFTAGGAFATHQGEAARRTRNTMAYATAPGRWDKVAAEKLDFKTVYTADVAPQDHWHYNADVEVKLDEPAGQLFVKYVGDPAVNNVRVYAHCVEEKPTPPQPVPTPVRITHAWREAGDAAEKTKTVRLSKPGAYEVECVGEPADAWIEIENPSER